MDLKFDAIVKEEVEPLWCDDPSGVELEINYKEYHQTERRYETRIRDIKVEEEEGEYWQQREGIYIFERNGYRDGIVGEKEKEDKNNDSKDEEVQINEGDGRDCGDETETVKTANGKKYVRCHHCGEKRKTKKEVKEHIYSEHLSLFVEIQRGADETENIINKHRCTFCFKEFKYNSYLLKHIRTHKVEKPFQQDRFKYRDSRKSALKDHIDTKEKLFKCDRCEYMANYRGRLKMHKLKHTDEKPYKCNICEYKTSWKGNLKSHMFKHTYEKPFKCNQCDYEGSRKDYLKRHMVKHTEEFYKCSICGYKSYYRAALKKHMLKHPGEKLHNC